MSENAYGKLLVYASDASSRGERLKSVSTATERMAGLLKLNVEVVTFSEEFTPIYVYYKNGNQEPIPLYCNKGEETEEQEIYAALKNILFVLSFHPKHSALSRVREEVTLFS